MAPRALFLGREGKAPKQEIGAKVFASWSGEEISTRGSCNAGEFTLYSSIVSYFLFVIFSVAKLKYLNEVSV